MYSYIYAYLAIYIATWDDDILFNAIASLQQRIINKLLTCLVVPQVHSLLDQDDCFHMHGKVLADKD